MIYLNFQQPVMVEFLAETLEKEVQQSVTELVSVLLYLHTTSPKVSLYVDGV